MDYKHWSEFLSEEEFKNWEIEALVAHLDGDYFDESDNIFYNQYHSLHSFISSSFAWRDTKQGPEYWRIIANKEENGL